MLRGNIDFVSRTRVEGWVYSPQLAIADTQILAFVDDQCVGAGRADVFRQDLVEAGLGDGVCGFAFSITLEPSQDPGSVDIRLHGGNALIRQNGSRLVSRQEQNQSLRHEWPDVQALSWMRARQWLTPAQYHAKRLLIEFGLHVQSVAASIAESEEAVARQEIAAIARESLEFQIWMPLTIDIVSVANDRALDALRARMHTEFPRLAPIIGLWTPHSARIAIVEGSHLPPGVPDSTGAVEYNFGGERLLWLDLDTHHRLVIDDDRPSTLAVVPQRAGTQRSGDQHLPSPSLA